MAIAMNDEDQSVPPHPVVDTGAARPAREEFVRAGCVVRADRTLGEIVRRRPTGITAHQWSAALRTRLDFVGYDGASGDPAFIVDFADPDHRPAEATRAGRMVRAVCEAVGLEQLQIEASALHAGAHGRRIVEYLVDARAFTAAMVRDDTGTGADPPPRYREIIGRLPDGRSGYVNDLGAVARAAAVDAFVSGRLADPIVRGLHVCWTGGTGEGWAWLALRGRSYLFERVTLRPHRFTCGVPFGQLAEDLATAAIGERLKQLGSAPPVTHDGADLRRELEALRARRDEMAGGFAFDHVYIDAAH